MGSDLVQPMHLQRQAVVYVRQSTPHQVVSNQESLRLQYALGQRARDLGWPEGNIAMIDADLGLSGAAASHRAGYKELVAQVAAGEVGIILSVDVTRLARNCSDWYPLLDVCGHRQCLIADRDGVYDPGSPNGRLLLGLKGTISEVELHTIRGRLTAGLLAKAARGDLPVMLPTGLVRDATGMVTKDPDIEVQARICLVFSLFQQVRTAMGVVRALIARNLTLPRRDRHGDTVWRAPTLAAVIDFLKNPAYAGAFVYGRTRMRESRMPGCLTVKVPREQADWRFVVMDKYPAYIDWETFERIQALLRDNRAEYGHLQTRGIPRDGAALLHGLLWCGECGHKMVVRYAPRSMYVCNQLRHQIGAAVCWELVAAPVDAAVAAAFLEAVAPAEVEAWMRALQTQRRSEEALHRAETQQIERLRYQATLAERQFHRVDPDNRLVAAELERRWEVALLELRKAEQALEQRQQERRGGHAIDPALRKVVVQLGPRISDLWADPAVGRDRRKALLRCLIEKVILERPARGTIGVRIVWRGGAVTPLTVPVPVSNIQALPSFAAMQARLLALHTAGLSDGEIAATLTAEGFRSPRCLDTVLQTTVASLRRQIGLKANVQQERWRLPAGIISIITAARRLGVDPSRLYKRVFHGTLALPSDPQSGRMIVPDTETALQALRRLLNGEVRRLDLREHAHHEEGHHYG